MEDTEEVIEPNCGRLTAPSPAYSLREQATQHRTDAARNRVDNAREAIIFCSVSQWKQVADYDSHQDSAARSAQTLYDPATDQHRDGDGQTRDEASNEESSIGEQDDGSPAKYVRELSPNRDRSCICESVAASLSTHIRQNWRGNAVPWLATPLPRW